MSRLKIRRKTCWEKRKWLLGVFVLIIFFGSSINGVFAEQNIQSLLTDWFNQKKTDSIEEIEDTIDSEQHEQTKRIQAELQSEIEKIDEQLVDFTDQEKEKRRRALQEHADEIIADIDLDDTEQKKEMLAELERIIQEAKEKMDNVPSGYNEEANRTETDQSEND